MISRFDPPPHLTVQLAGTEAPRSGRVALSGLLATAGTELSDGALLVASELVTNAIQAAELCTMSAWFLAEVGAVRIEVTDTAGGRPEIRPAGDGRTGGYGLRIVDHISSRWGVVEHDVGKTTWSEIDSSSDSASI